MSRFRFSHHLVQRYVYESLSAGERRLLHKQVAETIEDLFAEDIETAAIQLAYHYGHTEEKAKTLHYMTQAGHQARKRYDADQAAHYYSQALSLAAEDSSDRFHLLAARAAVYDTLAQRDAQKADIETMEALARQLGERGLHCDALLALSDFYLATEMFRAREPAEQARAEAREIGDAVREARALRRLSWEGRLGADLQTSRLYLEQAADQFKRAGLPGEAAGCLLMLARRLPVSAKHVFELDLAEQAMVLADQSGDYGLQANAKKHLAIACTLQGRDDRALPLAQASLGMQRDLGDRHEQGSTLDVVGVILARLGRREEAFAALERCLTLSEEIGSDWGVLGAVFGLWNYRYVPDGEYEQLFAFIDERLCYAAVHERAWLSGFLYWLKTKGLADVGHYDEALSLTQTAAYQATEPTGDLVSRACVLQLAGSDSTA
jgi:tetratricopeptide (TPR) repeat protein